MKAINTMPRSSQKGSAMIISLAILALMTVAAAFNMQRTTLQVRMVNNLQDKNETTAVAYSALQTMMGNMNSDDFDSSPLSSEVNKHRAKIFADKSDEKDKFDIFEIYKWDYPELPNVSASAEVENKVFIDKIPDKVPHSLKYAKGNSQGSKSNYYLSSTFVSRSSSGKITTYMEQGFLIEAPGVEY
jgi:type II secretory pathway pseudopilin PulG